MLDKDKKYLQFLHDRMVNVYGESENVDFLIKFREIINSEESLDIPDIRNKLGSIVSMIELVERDNIKYKHILLRTIPTAKKAINYLAKRDVFKF